jgi:hypothetical protein
MSMVAHLKRGLARMVAARDVMLKARSARSEALQRFRTFASTRLNDFAAAVDPITGARMVELLAEGSKVSGDLSVTIAFFDGTRLRIAIDPRARIEAEANPPDVLHEVGNVLDILVAPDLSRAELVYEPTVGPRGTRARLDLDDLIARLVDSCAQSIEEETAAIAPPPPRVAPLPPRAAPPSAVAPAPKPGLSYSVG